MYIRSCNHPVLFQNYLLRAYETCWNVNLQYFVNNILTYIQERYFLYIKGRYIWLQFIVRLILWENFRKCNMLLLCPNSISPRILTIRILIKGGQYTRLPAPPVRLIINTWLICCIVISSFTIRFNTESQAVSTRVTTTHSKTVQLTPQWSQFRFCSRMPQWKPRCISSHELPFTPRGPKARIQWRLKWVLAGGNYRWWGCEIT